MHTMNMKNQEIAETLGISVRIAKDHLMFHDHEKLAFYAKSACDVYYNRKEDWEMLQRNALNTDVSWQQSAKTYSLLYDELVD